LQENTLARDHAFPPEPGFGNALSNDAALRRNLGISADVTRITNAQSCACHASTNAASGNVEAI